MLNGMRIWVKGAKISGTKISNAVVTNLSNGRLLLTGHTTNGRTFMLAGTADELSARVTLR